MGGTTIKFKFWFATKIHYKWIFCFHVQCHSTQTETTASIPAMCITDKVTTKIKTPKVRQTLHRLLIFEYETEKRSDPIFINNPSQSKYMQKKMNWLICSCSFYRHFITHAMWHLSSFINMCWLCFDYRNNWGEDLSVAFHTNILLMCW